MTRYTADLTRPKDAEGHCVPGVDRDWFPKGGKWGTCFGFMAVLLVVLVCLLTSCAPITKPAVDLSLKAAMKSDVTLIDNTMTVCRTDEMQGGLNVRRGPGINYLVIDYLQNGDTVTILETVGKWRKVEFVQDGETVAGFAHVYYLCNP